jgi:hypothetical protein
MSVFAHKSALLRAAGALVLILSASAALASGSDGGGGAETGDTAAYNRGKSVYASKLACGSCPLAGKKLDAALARELLASKPAAASLSPEEAGALDTYLKRRFKL